MHKKLFILLVVVAVCGVAVFAVMRAADDATAPAAGADGTFSRPMPWTVEGDTRVGTIDTSGPTLTVGEVTVAAPVPAGATLAWTHASESNRHVLRGAGTAAEHEVEFTWSAAHGNPHTVFSGSLTATRGALKDELVSTIELPAGEVTYLNEALQRVPFAGTPIRLSSLTRGPIIWRNGEDTLAIWQWRADRVVLSEGDGGAVQIQFYWWDPAMHPMPKACAGEVSEIELRVEPTVTISFGEVPQFGFGRLPSGVTSAVIPVFMDPQDLEDVRFQDGASGSAEDFVNRARTIAFGHSSTADARYGNGGLAGLDVGGTIAVPRSYDPKSDEFAELRETTQAAEIELLGEDELRPHDCESLATGLGRGAPLLREGRAFDGKFPNLFSTDQHGSLPGLMAAPSWQPTTLTGRRKDVVTQALSATYLGRLAEVRGIALLEIPIVATRNPLVAIANEALLEPERNGQWTIEESVARALGEVELLSEDDRFDFIAFTRFAAFTAAIGHVEIAQQSPRSWTVFNRGPAIDGFTLLFDHEVSVLVDGKPVATSLRTLGNGARQTWAYWDLAEGAPYELEVEGDIAPAPISWSLAQ